MILFFKLFYKNYYLENWNNENYNLENWNNENYYLENWNNEFCIDQPLFFTKWWFKQKNNTGQHRIDAFFHLYHNCQPLKNGNRVVYIGHPLSLGQTCNQSVFLNISHEILYKLGHLPKRWSQIFKIKSTYLTLKSGHLAARIWYFTVNYGVLR